MTAVCLFLCTSHWFVLQRSKEQREWPVVLIQQLMSDVRILTPLFSFHFVCVLGEGAGGALQLCRMAVRTSCLGLTNLGVLLAAQWEGTAEPTDLGCFQAALVREWVCSRVGGALVISTFLHLWPLCYHTPFHSQPQHCQTMSGVCVVCMYTIYCVFKCCICVVVTVKYHYCSKSTHPF